MKNNVVVRHLTAEDARRICPIEDNLEELVAVCLNSVYRDIERAASWGWVRTVFIAHNYSQKVVVEVEKILVEKGYDVERILSEDRAPGSIRCLIVKWE